MDIKSNLQDNAKSRKKQHLRIFEETFASIFKEHLRNLILYTQKRTRKSRKQALLLGKAFGFFDGKRQLLHQLFVTLVGRQIQTVEAGVGTRKP